MTSSKACEQEESTLMKNSYWSFIRDGRDSMCVRLMPLSCSLQKQRTSVRPGLIFVGVFILFGGVYLAVNLVHLQERNLFC